jgi:heavy metal efflux system protein
MEKPKPFFASLIFSFILAGFPAGAQKVYTLQECIDAALKSNQNLKRADIGIDYSRQLKKISTDIPKTTFMYTQGQFNSIYQYDNNITVSQVIPFPTVFISHNALSGALIKSSKYNYDMTKAELVYHIKTHYYSLLYYMAVNELLNKEDTIFAGFVESVSKKYREGKSNLLEKTSSETRLLEIKNQILENEEDLRDQLIQLRTLMNTREDFNVAYADITEKPLEVSVDSTNLDLHPLMKYLKQQVEVSARYVAFEKARIMPDIALGYFNQSIYGPANVFGDDYFLTTANRLQGFQVGLTVPLWFYPHKAKVDAAKTGIRLAQSDYDYHSTLISGQYGEAVNFYMKYRKSIGFYKNNVITSSRLIIEEALAAYNKGEINYVEYLEIVQHALATENNYLKAVYQNNMAALKIEYLLVK